MIIDNFDGRLTEIKAFAKEYDLKESFNETFSRLKNYSFQVMMQLFTVTLLHLLKASHFVLYFRLKFDITLQLTKKEADVSPFLLKL